MRLVVILWILPSHYTRRYSHDSPSVSVLVPYSRPRTHTSITARNAIICGGTGGPRILERACVRDGHSDLSSSLRRGWCLQALDSLDCRTWGRTIDTVIYRRCAMQIAIESYIQCGVFIAEMGLLFLPRRLMIHLGTAGPWARHAYGLSITHIIR